MAANVPAKLKGAQIAPFAKRAQELENENPIITYWLRFYMTQKIIKDNLHTADQECTAFTTDLMEKLEQAKAEYPEEDALVDEVAAQAYCEQFALTAFARGDRDMRMNTVTKSTPDTLLAAATYFDILRIWKADLDAEIKAKQKYAKYHALRIVKALKAGEDPNLSNPVQEKPHPVSPPALEPNDPEVQKITQNSTSPPIQNPYQSYVESAPDASVQHSPTFSGRNISPPPNLPSAPTGYSQSSHRDVSPISQPASSRHGSVTSAGGGYFPRVDVPTFTAGATAPSLPTAPSVEDEPMTSPFEGSSLPSGPSVPQAPEIPDPSNFYQNPASPPPVQQPPQQPPPPPQNLFQSPPQQSGYVSPPPTQPPHQPSTFQTNPVPQQHFQYSPQPPQPPQPHPQQYAQPTLSTPQGLHQGPFNTDEESVMEAQKHAKWAISALNFEDVNTAVKELRVALRALGAN